VLDLLLSHLPTILSAITGGGLVTGVVKLYTAYHQQSRKDEAQDAELRNDRVEAQAKRLDQLHDRLTDVERKQEEERKARVEAEVENKRLRAMVETLRGKIDQLISMVQDLRAEAGMEPLSDDEEERLRDTPDYTSNTDSQQDAATE